MKDCSSFAQTFLHAIPNGMRDYVEATHRSFVESHVMLQQYARALAAEKIFEPAPIVVAFGSFGRLDGSSLLSDYDVLFLYPGPPNTRIQEQCRDLIMKLVRSNSAMLFDHRASLEAGSFDFDKSPAYPVLSTDQLLDPKNETRALQLLTEGRVILGSNEAQVLRSQLLTRGGYTENVHELDLSQLRSALARMKTSYCRGVIGRLTSEPRQFSNRKVLKLFALREFSYIACLYSLADIAIAASIGICSPEQAARTLSAPSVNKIASFTNPTGAIGNLLASLPPNVREELTNLVNELRSQNSSAVSSDSGEAPFFGYLRIPILSLLSKYDALLRLLHDVQFVELIDRYESGVTNWIGLRHFQRITTLRNELIAGTKDLSTLLRRMLDIASLGKPSPALEDAQSSLREVEQYELELKVVS